PPPPPYSLILSSKSTFLVISTLLLTLFGQAQSDPKPFITTWQTTTASETITIPTVSGETYNYSVKWGDGSEITTHTNATPPSHTYVTADTYTITISGTFPRIRFGETDTFGNVTRSTAADQIRSIEQWGDIVWASMKSAFAGCRNLAFNADDVPDFSNVTNMKDMFVRSSFNGDISKWNVSSVTSMNSMFWGSDFNQDLSKWDISSVTNITNMFNNNTSMSSENYDKLLIGWSTLDEAAGENRIPSNVPFSAPDKYSCRGKAGRDALTGATHSWTITGDELIPIRTDAAALPTVTAQCEVTKAELNAPPLRAAARWDQVRRSRLRMMSATSPLPKALSLHGPTPIIAKALYKHRP
ncbi:MAG: BspA family leucine-rich repeat surface protein, partial [Ekhidna sp.]|nr:BspA family leucine-rich repeat surface protein [Ekhidna sp.]